MLPRRPASGTRWTCLGVVVATLAAGASPAQEKDDQGKLSWALHELAWSMERGRRPSASSRRYVDPYAATVVTVVELGAGRDLEEVRAPIESLSATIDAVDPEMGWLEVTTPIGALRQLGELPAVARIRLPLVPTPTAIVSQGVPVMGADDFIQRTGADGTGVTVGVLDASWENPQALLGSELPADTEISSAILEGDAFRHGPHGDACAEIVHDVAPGAHLATTPSSWSPGTADAPSFEADNPAIIASSQNRQSVNDLPRESMLVDVEETRELFVVVRRDERTAAGPDQKLFVYAQHAVLEHYTAAGTITSPADASSVVAVGAVYVDTLEHPWYNSLGPTEDGRIKPDLAAPSHVATASFGREFRRNVGSDSARHRCGALLLSLYPHLDTDELRLALETATASGGDPARKNNAVGFGVMDLRSVR